MPLDASIYQGIQAPQQISPMDSMSKALSLSNLSMQNKEAQLQMQNQQAVNDAYAGNVRDDGSIDQRGVLSDLAKNAPRAYMQTSQQMTAMQNAQAEAQGHQAEAVQKVAAVSMPYLEYLNKADPSQKPVLYHNIMSQLAAQGIPMHNVPSEFNQEWLNSTMETLKNSVPYTEQQLKQTNIEKNKVETAKIYNDIGEMGDKRLIALKDDLDPNKSRGGNMAKNQAVVDSADRLNAMFKQFPDYNIPKAQQTELVSAFGSLLNGGSAPFVSQLEELVPKSARGDANAMASWVLNQPAGAEQQKFMELLHESVNREREVADSKVKTAQVQRLSAHQLLQKTNPQAVADVLHSYGIDPDSVKNGKYAPSDQEQNYGPGKQLSKNKSSDLINSANAGDKENTITPDDANALQWLKTADQSDPVTFKVRSKLKSKGLIK